MKVDARILYVHQKGMLHISSHSPSLVQILPYDQGRMRDDEGEEWVLNEGDRWRWDQGSHSGGSGSAISTKTAPSLSPSAYPL